MKRKNQILSLVHTSQVFDLIHFSQESLKFRKVHFHGIRYWPLSLIDSLLLLISVISVCALSFDRMEGSNRQVLLSISTNLSTEEFIHLQLLIINSDWRYSNLGNRKDAFDLLRSSIYFLSNSCQMVRKEMGIKGSIKAACVDTIINTFFHQVFLGLTLSLMRRIFPRSTIFRWDLESNHHEIIFRNANFRDYEFLFQKQQIENHYSKYCLAKFS